MDLADGLLRAGRTGDVTSSRWQKWSADFKETSIGARTEIATLMKFLANAAGVAW